MSVQQRPAVRFRDLTEVLHHLSTMQNLSDIMATVRTVARTFTAADGATFVLREGNQVYYADEDAIAPLWKGSRFPMECCISGWVMLHRTSAVVRHIYDDPRIPVDAYRPTFVKSLAMVPIRRDDPLGAIGAYWAHEHLASPDEVAILEQLAESTAVILNHPGLNGA